MIRLERQDAEFFVSSSVVNRAKKGQLKQTVKVSSDGDVSAPLLLNCAGRLLVNGWFYNPG